MTTDLVGIENENGYYPPAFMTSTLADEVNEAIERWNSESDDEISPEKHLKSIANEYLQSLRRYKDASSRTIALEAAKECRELILRALSIPAPEISVWGGVFQRRQRSTTRSLNAKFGLSRHPYLTKKKKQRILLH